MAEMMQPPMISLNFQLRPTTGEPTRTSLRFRRRARTHAIMAMSGIENTMATGINNFICTIRKLRYRNRQKRAAAPTRITTTRRFPFHLLIVPAGITRSTRLFIIIADTRAPQPVMTSHVVGNFRIEFGKIENVTLMSDPIKNTMETSTPKIDDMNRTRFSIPTNRFHMPLIPCFLPI